MKQLKKVTKSYTLAPEHIATVRSVATTNGGCSESAALRFIIEKYVQFQAQKENFSTRQELNLIEI